MINLNDATGRCDGCLGSRKCWVCLGTGQIEDRFRRQSSCPACEGTGVCANCQAVPDQRPEVTVDEPARDQPAAGRKSRR